MGDYKPLNAGSPDSSQASGVSMRPIDGPTPEAGLSTEEAKRRYDRDG
jgi:hypothetical protein